jgi:hypothetical protein
MVRKGGFEPPRLSAPPPQDGVSASSTTSARCNSHAFNILARSTSEGNSHYTGLCADLLHFTRVSSRRQVPQPRKQFFHPIFSWMKVAHGRLNRIVSSHVLQSEELGMLAPLGEKRVPQRMQSGVRVG